MNPPIAPIYAGGTLMGMPLCPVNLVKDIRKEARDKLWDSEATHFYGKAPVLTHMVEQTHFINLGVRVEISSLWRIFSKGNV